jgi:cardiolipin synthase
MYDETIAQSLKDAFIKDLSVCSEVTAERYASRSVKIKIKESISRLFSAML